MQQWRNKPQRQAPYARGTGPGPTEAAGVIFEQGDPYYLRKFHFPFRYQQYGPATRWFAGPKFSWK